MNLYTSVKQRLLKLARERREDFQWVLTRYALERLLYRLGVSEYRNRFILKGAMLFAAWTDFPHRPTRDLDLLGYGSQDLQELARTFREICSIEVEPDGIDFLVDTVHAEEIMDNTEYGGIRVRLEAALDTARIPLQIDIGFGDAITPAVRDLVYPCCLDFPAPNLRVYPTETVVAEKYQAIVYLGMGNSRMKDYYDLWIISQRFSFEGSIFSQAIRNTFERRGTEIPGGIPQGISREFERDRTKLQQWKAFLNRNNLQTTAPELSEVLEHLREFLLPPTEVLRTGGEWNTLWRTGGPWRID